MKIFSNKHTWLIILIFATILSRLLVIDGNFEGYSWDTGNFALAAEAYSLEEGRPHLPGYFLHIQYIILLSRFTGDHYISMLLLSILYSVLATVFIFLLSLKWFELRDTILITLLITSNPIVLYYGSVAEIYIFDLFLSSALVYFGISPHAILFTPVLLALGTGIRPSSGLLLLPVYIYLWTYHFRNRSITIKTAIAYHVPALVVFLSWFAPLVISAGGIGNYFNLYISQNPVEKISIWQSIFRFSSYLAFLLPAVFIFGIAYLREYFRKKTSAGFLQRAPMEILYTLGWWLVPPLLFFLFFHYSKGYILLCLAPLFYLLIYLLNDRRLRQGSMIAATVIQLLIFFALPYRYPDVQIYFKSEERALSITDMWVERTTSDHLMTALHLRALQDSKIIIKHAMRLLEKESKVLKPKKEYLFIDPTCMITARALQAAHPHIKFAKFLFREKDQYGFHQGLVQEARRNPGEMLSRAIIISRMDFVNQYLTDIKIHPSDPTDAWVMYTVDPDDAEKLYERYTQLFGRY